MSGLADMLGTSRRATEQTLAKAKAAQLVYPDGTVNRKANAYLNALVMKEIPKELIRAK